MLDHETSEELRLKFGTIANYLVLCGMLVCSALIGVFFWLKGQSSPEEILMGGGRMHFLPVTFSLVASFLSAYTLLGMPAEIYTQGTQFLTILLFTPVTAIAIITVFLPVFHRIQVPSSFHYLELRFNHTIKILAAGLSALNMIPFIAIIVYMPALAVEQVTGINVDITCATIFLVCVFYTSLGGIKAVIWTDVFQLSFMFFATGSILLLSTMDVGGPQAVIDKNNQAGMIQFWNTSPDPRERHTIWGTVLGGGFMWMAVFGVAQHQVQRYLSLPTIQEAKKACILTMLIMSFLIIMVGWMGMVLYATYEECDPITVNQVRKMDQLLPFLVLHVAGDIPALPGLYMAGVFSGSLSTISSGLNSLAAVALNDFVPESAKARMGKYKQALLTKIFSLMFGLLGYGITFLLRFMPGMFEFATVLSGAASGPVIGIFLVGMLLPWVNSRGAILGFMGSVMITTWVATGGLVYKSHQPYISTTSPPYPNSTFGCPESWLENWTPTNSTQKEPLPGHIALYDISYIWYSFIGLCLVFIISLTYTCLISSKDLSELDSYLLAPFMSKIMPSLPLKLRQGWRNKWEDNQSEKTTSVSGCSFNEE